MRSRRKSAAIFFLAAIFLLLITAIFLVWKGRLWREAGRFTFVLNGDPLTVVSLEPNTHQAAVLTIPANTFLEVPFGYGDYKASSIFRLGKLENKHRSGFLLTRSVENSLGIMIDGYVSPKEGMSKFSINSSEDIKNIKKNYFSYTSLPGVILKFLKEGSQYETNLTLADLYRIWQEIKNLRSDKIKLINMSESTALTDNKLADQTTVKIIDNDIFDFVIGNDFEDIIIRFENVSLEVVNATDVDKLATQVGRVLKNLGANVIAKTTSEQTEKFSCLVKVFNKRNGILIKRLVNHYQCKMEDGTNMKEASSVDIKLLLGEGFIK